MAPITSRGSPSPQLTFPSASGEDVDLATAAKDTLVLYCYPRTGRPGEPLPPGWDQIPGARGCTPQSCAFRDHFAELKSLAGARGRPQRAVARTTRPSSLSVSASPTRCSSDPELALAGALRLPTFEVAGMRLYRRLTLIARRREIVKVFYPVFPPDRNAADVCRLASRHNPG